MSGLVIDASVVGNGFDRVEASAALFAPELIDLEIANLLRKAVLRGIRSADEAGDQLGAWMSNPVVRFPHRPLLPAIWGMRHSITSYDAAYVALAAELGVPLFTADRRLAAAASRYCEVMAAE